MLLDPFLQHGSPQGSLHRDISIRFITEAPFAFASLPALYFGTAFKIQTTVWIFKDYDSIIPGLHGKLCRRNYWELVCSCKHEDLKFTSFVGWFTNPHAFVSSTLHNNRPTQATGLCLRIKSFLIWCWTCSLFFWESQPSRISTLAELVQPCCCVIREKLTRLMKCNLTGEGWGGGLAHCWWCFNQIRCCFLHAWLTPLYHSHHIPRVMASGSSRISLWVGLWCRSTRNVTLPGQSIASTWVISLRGIWWLVLSWRRSAMPWESYPFNLYGSCSAGEGPPANMWFCS